MAKPQSIDGYSAQHTSVNSGRCVNARQVMRSIGS